MPDRPTEVYEGLFGGNSGKVKEFISCGHYKGRVHARVFDDGFHAIFDTDPLSKLRHGVGCVADRK